MQHETVRESHQNWLTVPIRTLLQETSVIYGHVRDVCQTPGILKIGRSLIGFVS